MNYFTSSGLLSAGSTSVSDLPGSIGSVILVADGTNAATVIIYDSENTTTSGRTVLAKLEVPAGQKYAYFHSPFPIVANRGVLAVVSGTGSGAIAHFTKG